MNARQSGSYVGHRALMLALFGRSGQPPAWRADAACVGQDTEVFFDSGRTEDTRTVCAGCPVQVECRADQFAWESQVRSRRYYTAGMVGGLTASQRNQQHYPRTKTTKSTPTTAPVDQKDVA